MWKKSEKLYAIISSWNNPQSIQNERHPGRSFCLQGTAFGEGYIPGPHTWVWGTWDSVGIPEGGGEYKGSVMGRSTRYREKIRPLAFNRDKKNDAPCWICGQKIDYLAQLSTTPDSWEGDHVNAVANGGAELDLKNIKACHKRCNRVRGAGDNNNVIGQRSRIW